jgi:tRNA (cmo5U34)-methyltransferase
VKLTPAEIGARYAKDVDRFSNLETGQVATVDAPLCLELIGRAAHAATPDARTLLDIGCGAGNFALTVLEHSPDLDCTLADLSRDMLDRAFARVSAATKGAVATIQGDFRELSFGEGTFDIIVASATLHHLRADEEWHAMFAKVFRALRPGGSFWVFDIVEHAMAPVEALLKEQYGDYLIEQKGGGGPGKRYRRVVFNHIAEEDTPRPLTYQLELLRKVGFADIDVLHKRMVYAAFGARKAS